VADADFPQSRIGSSPSIVRNQPCASAASARLAAVRIAGEAIVERLRSALSIVGARIVLTTSFGMEAQLIAHHIFTERLPIHVTTLDTGRLFPETYAVWQQTEERYGVRIGAHYPDRDAVRSMVADSGINGFYQSKEARLACCDVRKVQPLERALEGASAWMVGLRADQSRHRASVRLARWDERRHLIRIMPLFDWSREQVARECERLGVPVNALHAAGYPSIGCEPCTRAVGPTEQERAGRWWWETDEVKECGLHFAAPGKPIRTRAA
jgi:phosphoadenosine phosphosulfate reductase